MSVEDVLYEDKFCRLTNSELTIFAYYLPCPLSRKIKLSTIKGVYYGQTGCCLNIFGTKFWGMVTLCSSVWWALDCCRQTCCNKNIGCVIDCGERVKKGFSVQEFNEFLAHLQPLLLPETSIIDSLPNQFCQ